MSEHPIDVATAEACADGGTPGVTLRGGITVIEVRVHHSLTELDPVAMEKVNASSERASLFASPAWLGHFLAHDVDFHARGCKPFILTAWEGGRLKGYLPLKANHDRGGRVLSCLIIGEVVRPQVVCAPEDVEGVTHAFFQALLSRADEWDLLEFVQQDQTSALRAPPPGLTGRHWLRRLEDRPNNVLSLSAFNDIAAYAAGLSPKMRYSNRKHLKGLLAAPRLTVTIAREPRGGTALFEVFLDIERRSWKHRADAGVGTREKTYRAALEDPGVELTTSIASSEGVPFAGSVSAHYGKRTYGLQIAHAESHEALAPGTLMIWLAIAEAFERRSLEFDMLADFPQYKARWGAKTIATQWVQIFRVGSRRHLRAVAVDFWRKVAPPPPPAVANVGKNPYKVAAGPAAPTTSFDQARLDALLATARAAGAVEHDAAALKARNPFS